MKETKRCPYCGEEILAVAKKCKYCGEWLEPKVAEKAKKACPICGEMIDEDADVCPYCHEHIERQVFAESVVSTAENSSNGQGESGDGFSYCKTCGHRLSIDASVCVECGETDPFCFNEIKSIEKKSHFGCWTFIVMCFAVELLFQLFGVNDGVVGWLLCSTKWPQLLVLVIFIIIHVSVSKYNMKESIDKLSKEIEAVIPQNVGRDVMTAWWQRVRAIVGETWFSILW